MAKLTGAHLFIRCLKLEGIEKIFTIVGDTILPLVDAAEDEGIQFIDTRHEGAALHMADGYARITGRPAVGMFTGGPRLLQRHLGPSGHLHLRESSGVRRRMRRAS